MVIEINKNIDNYKESVVLGLSARQLVYAVLSVVVGGGIVLLLYRHQISKNINVGNRKKLINGNGFMACKACIRFLCYPTIGISICTI